MPHGLTDQFHEDTFERDGGYALKYRFPSGYGLSCINHNYSYVRGGPGWEIAITLDGALNYDTNLTSDVEVFHNNADANAFIDRAIEELS